MSQTSRQHSCEAFHRISNQSPVPTPAFIEIGDRGLNSSRADGKDSRCGKANASAKYSTPRLPLRRHAGEISRRSAMVAVAVGPQKDSNGYDTGGGDSRCKTDCGTRWFDIARAFKDRRLGPSVRPGRLQTCCRSGAAALLSPDPTKCKSAGTYRSWQFHDRTK